MQNFGPEDYNIDISVELLNTEATIEEGSVGNFTIPSGRYEHKIKVIDIDKTEYEYTVIFIRKPSEYKYLEGITIDGNVIEGFNPTKLNYEIELPYNSKDNILVDVIKARPDQKINGIDSYQISYKPNMIIIDVTAEDKINKARYTISVKKESTTKLKYCDIEKQEFADIFESEKYEYEFDVTSGVITLNITAIPYDEDAKVQIKGAGYLREGRNLITITVSKEGLEDTVYKITVIKGENLGVIPYDFDYTGDYQVFTAPAVGYYKFECWGAQGSGGPNTGRGGYTSGVKRLNAGDTFYIYVGGNQGKQGWNGGGISLDNYYTGGGATDIRLVPGEWNNEEGLRSRIMVAGRRRWPCK